MQLSSDDDAPLVVVASKVNSQKQKKGDASSHRSNGKRALDNSSDDSDDERPLAKRVKSAMSTAQGAQNGHGNGIKTEDSDEDDAPLAVMTKKVPMPGAHAAAVGATSSRSNRRSNGKSYKEESSDDDNVPPISSKASQEDDGEDESSDSSDEEPLVKKTAKRAPAANGKAKAPAKKRKKSSETSDEDMDSDTETEKPTKKAKAPPKKRVKKEVKDEDDMDIDEVKSPRPKKESKQKAPKAKKEEEEEEVFKWWEEDAPEDVEGDGSKKWDTLVHAGLLFPPPYIPLPRHVKMLYDGKPVDLPPESEEVAGFFAAMLETDHAQNAVFRANFFKDWQSVLADHPPRNGVKIKSIDKCDFRPMTEYIDAEKARLKRLTKAEKQELKEKKAKEEAPYATCMLNGRPEKVGNFRVEPPGLFRGRGEHPKKGCVKKRVRPEDIVINIGEGEKTPVPGIPGKWKEVQHDNTVTWLAHWKENINGQCKYVFLAATSSIKGKSDRDKFEKARELKNHIDRIRQDYQADLKSKVMADRQRATAMYLIDRYALRAGNEKGEDEADTVGCCSLRLEHVTLDKSGLVILDFLGKDSIRYYKEIDDIDPQVFKNLRLFKAAPKKDADLLFDRVTTSGMNNHLRSYMKGLTAKVFRTYNASTTFEKELLSVEFKPNALQQEKVNAYNAANKTAAELCNHQRAAPKNHAVGMAKMGLQIGYMKHQRMGMCRELFHQEPKLKKKYPQWAEPESDMEDEETIESFEEEYYTEKKKELTEGWERAKKVLEETGGTAEEIEARKEKADKKLGELEADYEIWVKHRKKAGYSFRGRDLDDTKEYTADQLVKMIEKQTEAINKMKLKQSDKENLKTISLTTSKINYLDPRITTAYCARHDLPITLFFTKTLRTKFPWAMDTKEEWRF
ncbi:DNA topoisomerase 1 [Serendipita sp. 411]|nr:DNA topoisomerase 1 [Serendipita sp. 398]KAG8847905.1 DNA topoisomerase 1 [Serendipita sp. 411]